MASTASYHQGSGIGLVLARQIAEALPTAAIAARVLSTAARQYELVLM